MKGCRWNSLHTYSIPSLFKACEMFSIPGHDPGPLDDWGSFEDFSNDPEYLRDKKSKENYFKGKYKK